MAKWSDLPNELHRAILRLFCECLIVEFERLIVDPWNNTPDEWLSDDDPFEWPKTPEPLVAYCSVLRTSRSFYHIVTREVKFNGESPRDILLRKQYETIRDILKQQSENEASGLMNVMMLYYIAGCFWRNPLALCESNFLDRVLVWITQGSRLRLIPHLERWLLSCARDDVGSLQTSALGIGGCVDDCEWLHFKNGPWEKRSDILYICSLTGVVDTHDDHDLKALISKVRNILAYGGCLREHGNDPRVIWWLFPPDDLGIAIDENEWTLVNYSSRTIWSGPDLSNVYCWENLWDCKSWERIQMD